jgi:hypothetical protein
VFNTERQDKNFQKIIKQKIMFRPDTLLGPRSSVAPGSDTERAALERVRAQRIADAEARGVKVPEDYGLGETALHGALGSGNSYVARLQERALDIPLPPSQDPEMSK